MKSKDILHAMNDIEPAQIEQAMRGETAAADIAEVKGGPQAERLHPVARIIGTAVSLAACAAVVTGGVLWIRSAGRPAVSPAAEASPVETEHALTTVMTDSAAAEASGTEIAPETTETAMTNSPEEQTAAHATVTSAADAPGTEIPPDTGDIAEATATGMETVTQTTAASQTSAAYQPGTEIPETTVTVLKTTTTAADRTAKVPHPASTPLTVKVWREYGFDLSYNGQMPVPGQIYSAVWHSREDIISRDIVNLLDCAVADWMNDAFFAEYDVIVAAVQLETGSYEIGVENVSLISEWTHTYPPRLQVNLAKYCPETYDCAMANYFVTVAVPKGVIEGNPRVYAGFADSFAADPDTHADQHDKFLKACPGSLYLEQIEEE